MNAWEAAVVLAVNGRGDILAMAKGTRPNDYMGVVLVDFGQDDPGTRYVVWLVKLADRATYSGTYCLTLEEAQGAFTSKMALLQHCKDST